MLAKLDKYVSTFEEAGITVIIDIHTDPTNNDLPYYAQPMYSIMVKDTAREGWLNFLKMLADRYKDKGNVIGFDILNEPFIGNSLQGYLAPLLKAKWQNWLQNKYKTIEAVNATFGSTNSIPSTTLETLTAEETSFDSINLPDRDRKSTRLNSSHIQKSRMPSSA